MTSHTLPAHDWYASGLAISHFMYAAANIGVDLRAEMETSGLLGPKDYEPLNRIPGERYEKMIMTLLLASEDPLFGFHVGQQLLIARYGLAPHAMLSSATLGGAIDLLLKFQELVGNMGQLVRCHDSQSDWLHWQLVHENPVLRRHITENVFTMVVQATRLGTGNAQMAPEGIDFCHAAPGIPLQQEMERFFLCPLRFDAPENRLYLSASALRTVLNPFEQSFAQQLENELAQQLRTLQEQDTLGGRIRHQLRLVMQQGLPRRQQVADGLGMSVRTLDRRMKEDGISWQALLDSLRANMARELLAQTELTMAEISQKLGFSDVRSFQRRFRHWTGMAPSSFRLNHP